MLSRPFLTVVSDGSGSVVAERAPANDWTRAEIASLRVGAGSHVNSSLSMASDMAKTRSGRNSSGMMTHPLRSMVILVIVSGLRRRVHLAFVGANYHFL